MVTTVYSQKCNNTITHVPLQAHIHTHSLAQPHTNFMERIERISDCFLILPPPPVLSLFHTHSPFRFTLIGTVILFIPPLLHVSLSTPPPLLLTFTGNSLIYPILPLLPLLLDTPIRSSIRICIPFQLLFPLSPRLSNSFPVS